MDFIPTPGCYKIVAQYLEDSGVVGVNVFNAIATGGSFDFNSALILSTFMGWYDAVGIAAITNNWALNQLEVRDVSVVDGRVNFYNDLGVTQGTHAGTPDALGIAMTITWKTGFAGKSFRGRTFVLGLPEEERTGRFWSDGIMASTQTVYDSLLGDFVDAGLPLVVVSKQRDGVALTTGVPTAIVSGRANKPVHKQWRRMTAP